MKKFCIRHIFLILLSASTLFGALSDKSAIVYYGDDISYPMVGIHDYIIVEPSNINVYRHGFDVYKKKMYAYVSIGEMDSSLKEYASIKKEWIIAKNKAWKSNVMDIANAEYREFLFNAMIEPQLQRGFENFFFDTLDSYQIATKTAKENKKYEAALATFINEFHHRYPSSKLIINRGFEIIDKVHESVNAVLFESYYKGVGGEALAYKDVSDKDREWLDTHLNKIKSYGLDIIDVDYLPLAEGVKAQALSKKIAENGLIPYIATRELDGYGVSSKNAIKREVFTLIDEQKFDRIVQEAHQFGATPLEYMGYIQKLYNIRDGLPKIKNMRHYAGVVIWLQTNYEKPQELIAWVVKLKDAGIKVVFINNFGSDVSTALLAPLGISVTTEPKQKKSVKVDKSMVGYELPVSMELATIEYETETEKPLIQYSFEDATSSITAAITEWGGYAVDDAFLVEINGEALYVMNPFKFFKEALRLEDILVPDVTTHNGKRLAFSHIDGDGIMNRVEGASNLFAANTILDKILKVYKIPHSVSVVGAEIDSAGIYPKLSPQLLQITKEIYKLKNVEAATHTFSHPFYWGKIENGKLDSIYRLKVKNYEFSLKNELSEPLRYINTTLVPEGKKQAKSVFWSGDYVPRVNALSYVYKRKLLNINGGGTFITNNRPWLSLIAPLGLERSGYYQIYTGAQNENIYTNEWHGPFWGFKQVVQTFELTNSPRRLKPIDIYYHFYSGSKLASIRALEYVFDWEKSQDTFPIFTSQYIPKVMDYYTVSIAKEKNEYFVVGMKNLKTLRAEKKEYGVNLAVSPTTVGLTHFENHTYISLNKESEHRIRLSESMDKDKSYMTASNGKITARTKFPMSESIEFFSNVDLKVSFYNSKKCKIKARPTPFQTTQKGSIISYTYKGVQSAIIDIECRE